MTKAKEIYDILCNALDQRGWRYVKEDDNLIVRFKVSGDDIPMDFVVIVDAERELVRSISPLPFEIKEEKRAEFAVAVCVANFGFVDGCFTFDISSGRVLFRAAVSFADSILSEDLFQYLISLSCSVMDDYNDKFLAINSGYLSIDEFIAQD